MLDTTPRPRTAAPGDRPAHPERVRAVWRVFPTGAALGALIVLVLGITALPYLYAYGTSPPDRRFVGVLVVPDTMQYFSWMRDHRSAWLVANRMTPEPNAPSLFNLLWLIVGRVGAATGWDEAALFQGLRVLAGAALLLVLYLVCGLFTSRRAERWTAYLTIVFGAGLGWIWVVEKYLRGLADVRYPLDVYVAEANTLQIITVFPHFTVATTLILAVLSCFLQAQRRASWRWAAAAALLALALTLQHAYDLLIIALVPAGMLGLVAVRDRRIPWRGVAMLGLIGAISAPPALYFTLLTSRDPLWRQVLAQFANAGVYTPPPPHLLVLMGLPLALALAGAAHGVVQGARLAGRLRRASDADLLLWSWFAVGAVLPYIPTDFQIHMLNAWQVPVALLAARVLWRQILPRLPARRPLAAYGVAAVLVLAAMPTNLYLVAWRTLDMGRHQAPYYLTADEDAALAWLGRHTSADDVVLSGLNLGQFVPVRSDARAFLAHWAQTAAFFDKQGAVQRFFAATTADSARAELLRAYGVTYVIAGPEERSLGSYDIAATPLLAPAFSSGDVTVYHVR